MIKLGNVRGFKKEDVRAVLIGEVIAARIYDTQHMEIDLKLDDKSNILYTLTISAVYVRNQLGSTAYSRLLRGKIENGIKYAFYALCLPNGNTAYHFKDYVPSYHGDLKEIAWLTKPDISAIGRGRDVSRSFTNGPKYKIVEQSVFPFTLKQ